MVRTDTSRMQMNITFELQVEILRVDADVFPTLQETGMQMN